MRRLTRILWNVVAAASLLLCLAAAGVWVRSYYVVDTVYEREASDTFILSSVGDVAFYRRTFSEPDAYRSAWQYQSWEDGTAEARQYLETRTVGEVRSLLGMEFSFARVGPPPMITVASAAVPHWLLVTLFALPPLACTIAWRRRRRRAALASGGRCPACGYDLRATPDRCPECGSEKHQAPSIKQASNPK